MLEWVTNGRASGRGTLYLSFEMGWARQGIPELCALCAEVRAVDSELELHPMGRVRQQRTILPLQTFVLRLMHHAIARSMSNVRASNILTAGEPVALMTSDSSPLGRASCDNVPDES
jgi:hypothetical protein